MLFILVAYAAQYLPWIFVPRETYIYHYFPSVPFVVLLITWFFKEEMRKPWAIAVYLLVVIGLFTIAYPVLSGMPFVVGGVESFTDRLTNFVLRLTGVNWR